MPSPRYVHRAESKAISTVSQRRRKCRRRHHNVMCTARQARKVILPLSVITHLTLCPRAESEAASTVSRRRRECRHLHLHLMAPRGKHGGIDGLTTTAGTTTPTPPTVTLLPQANLPGLCSPRHRADGRRPAQQLQPQYLHPALSPDRCP